MARLQASRVLSAVALMMTVAAPAAANVITFSQPTAQYIDSTCLLPIAPVGGLTSIEGCDRTVWFSDLVAAEAPGPFGWGDAPDTEGPISTVLRHLFTRGPLTVTLSEPAWTLGFEVASNRILGDTIAATFFDLDGNPHASIARTVEAGHALLFAAQTTDVPFTSVRIDSPIFETFWVGRIRIGDEIEEVPEPSLAVLCGVGVLAVLGARRRV
jgi:hypothetical protein